MNPQVCIFFYGAKKSHNCVSVRMFVCFNKKKRDREIQREEGERIFFRAKSDTLEI